MQRIKVKASTNYEVVIAKDLLKKAGVEIKKVIAPCKVLIVTDDKVAVKYLDTVTNSMLESGYTVYNYVIKHGEKAKSADNFIKIQNYLAMSANICACAHCKIFATACSTKITK
jgi:3-dehydroquinate synthase